jgi:hypothetical protein
MPRCSNSGLVDENLRQGLQEVARRLAHYVFSQEALSRGKYNRARTFLKAFVTHNHYSWPPVQLGIQLYGILASMQMVERPEQARRAATLFGAQDEMHSCLMNVIPLPERKAYDEAITSVKSTLSAEDFAAAFAEGRAKTTAQAIQFALDKID